MTKINTANLAGLTHRQFSSHMTWQSGSICPPQGDVKVALVIGGQGAHQRRDLKMLLKVLDLKEFLWINSKGVEIWNIILKYTTNSMIFWEHHFSPNNECHRLLLHFHVLSSYPLLKEKEKKSCGEKSHQKCCYKKISWINSSYLCPISFVVISGICKPELCLAHGSDTSQDEGSFQIVLSNKP